MTNTSELHCLVCGSTDTGHFLELKDNFVSKEIFNINSCKSCGFKFTADAPAEENIATYYKSENYISHSDTQKGLVNKLYHIVRNIMLERKWKLIKLSTQGRNLLDIGCGTGYFPHYMQQKGYFVSGMEIDSGARQFAFKHFNLKVKSPDELLGEKHTGEYDVITLWHVLEHLYDTETYLQWIHDSLKDDGFLFIALPNCSSLDADVYLKYWAAYDAPRHLWHFEPATFEKFISKFGFKLEAIRRLPYDAYYNSIMSARYLGKFMPSVHGAFIGLISNIRSFFSPQKCSSVIYILTKG